MRLALIVYHRNAQKLYPPRWIEDFKRSILNQTYKEFDIFECEYSGGDYRIFENSEFESIELPTFVDAMNYLLDKCFSLGYDYVLNTNLDDSYPIDRIEKQLVAMNQGIDIISSNFCLMDEHDIVFHTHYFHTKNIQHELNKENNVICHPVVSYSKHFWKHNRYTPQDIPFEDLLLWKQAIKKGCSFVILPDILCYHRIHNNSVCKSTNR